MLRAAGRGSIRGPEAARGRRAEAVMPITTPVSLLERLREAEFCAPDWAEFVQLYTPLILRWARGLKLQRVDAEDLAQDVLLHLARALRDFVYDERRGRFRDWLRLVTVRRWYQYGRLR